MEFPGEMKEGEITEVKETVCVEWKKNKLCAC